MERAGEAEAVDLGAASFLAGAFLAATAFLATALAGDFLAGEAMVVRLLGVFGVCPDLLFLATVSNFPPLLPSLINSVAREDFFELAGVAKIVLGVLLLGVAKVDGLVVVVLIGVLVNFNGEF